MIGWRDNGTYTHDWLWKRQAKKFIRASRDSKQLRYCRYYLKIGNKPGAYILTMCTFFRLDKKRKSK